MLKELGVLTGPFLVVILWFAQYLDRFVIDAFGSLPTTWHALYHCCPV